MDITDHILKFRNTVRFLWNEHFRGDSQNIQNWDRHEVFIPVYDALFEATVLFDLPSGSRLIPEVSGDDRLPGCQKQVLREYRIVGTDETLATMISRNIPNDGAWDHPTKFVKTASVDLRALSLYDWDEIGFRDYRYFEVRIISAKQKNLIGRDALVEANACRVILDESEIKVS